MFIMSNLSIELGLAGQSHIYLFKDNSLDSAALNPLDILQRQKLVGKITLLLSALNLKIPFPLANK